MCLPVAGARQSINDPPPLGGSLPIAVVRQDISQISAPPPSTPLVNGEFEAKTSARRVVVKLTERKRSISPDKPASRSKTPDAKSPLRASLPGLRAHPLEWPLPGVIDALLRCSSGRNPRASSGPFPGDVRRPLPGPNDGLLRCNLRRFNGPSRGLSRAASHVPSCWPVLPSSPGAIPILLLVRVNGCPGLDHGRAFSAVSLSRATASGMSSAMRRRSSGGCSRLP